MYPRFCLTKYWSHFQKEGLSDAIDLVRESQAADGILAGKFTPTPSIYEHTTKILQHLKMKDMARVSGMIYTTFTASELFNHWCKAKEETFYYL